MRLENAVQKYLRQNTAHRRPGDQDRAEHPLRKSARSRRGPDRQRRRGDRACTGAPLIVVDFGTATTFEYIDEKRRLSRRRDRARDRHLHRGAVQAAAKLPRIEFDMTKPKSVIGRNPVASMQAGIVFGYAGQVDGIVTTNSRGVRAIEAKVIATGGLAELIAKESRRSRWSIRC